MNGTPLMPAESCTELGADTAPARLGFLRRAVITGLHQRRAIVADERRRYDAVGAVGPVYHLNSLQQQLQLLHEIRALETGAPLKPTPTTVVVAIAGAAALIKGAPMRTIVIALLAALASLVITACITPEPGQHQRRLAPPDSNCKFESYCQVIQPNDPPASAARK